MPLQRYTDLTFPFFGHTIALGLGYSSEKLSDTIQTASPQKQRIRRNKLWQFCLGVNFHLGGDELGSFST